MNVYCTHFPICFAHVLLAILSIKKSSTDGGQVLTVTFTLPRHTGGGGDVDLEINPQSLALTSLHYHVKVRSCVYSSLRLPGY